MFGKKRESQVRAVVNALAEEDAAFRRSAQSTEAGRTSATLHRAVRNASPDEYSEALRRHRRRR